MGRANKSSDGRAGPSDLEATANLLRRVREGDESARDHLLARYLPILKRWAHGRLPWAARDLAETDDLVQITLLRALHHMEEFEYRREGAFLAYLRRILINSLRDEIRRAARMPIRQALHGDLRDPAAPMEPVGRETIESYESALAILPQVQQEAVILRIEFGFTYPEVAEAIGSPSANAARMMVTRALVRLAEEMNVQGA